MNKKAWFIILAVTSVVTVFTFASTWVLRPNSSTASYADKIFEEAKARQNQPLVSVSEPLRTNVEQISAEEKMARSVAELLASNSSFIEKISTSVNDDISDNLDAWGDSYEQSIISKVTEMNELSRQEMSNEIAKSANSVTTKFNGKLSAQDAKVVADVQEAKNLAEEMFVTSTKTTQLALDDLKAYFDAELAKTKANSEKSIKELNSLIEEKSTDTENYINQKSLDLTTYADIKAKTNADYSSSLLQEAKSYVDKAVLDVKDYVDQKMLEYKDEISYRPISIHTQLSLLDDYVLVDAYRGYALLSFPEYVTENDLKSGIDMFYGRYPELKDVVVFRVGRNDIVATYSQDFSEGDILFGLDAIENLLSEFEFVVPVKEEQSEDSSVEAVIVEDVIPVESEVVADPSEEDVPVDPYEFDLAFDLYLGQDIVSVKADSEVATFTLPANVPDETIYDWVSMLIMAYPEETSNFDFSVDDKVVSVGFIERATRDDVVSYLSFISEFYASNREAMMTMLVPSGVEVEETKPEETTTIEPVEAPEQSLEDIQKISLHKEYMLFSYPITVDATDDALVIVVPSFVTEAEIRGAMEAVANAYPNESSGLSFSVDGNVISFSYLREYTSQELEEFIDDASVVVIEYINTLLAPKVSIHKEYDLLGHKVIVDASDERAKVTVPGFVTRNEIAGALKSVAAAFPVESADFAYSIDGNTITLEYEAKYSEEKLEAYIESAREVIWRYVELLLTPQVPAMPSNISVNSTLVTRVPSPPTFVPAKPPVFTAQPEIDDGDIPAIRNAIRDIEVERYLRYL